MNTQADELERKAQATEQQRRGGREGKGGSNQIRRLSGDIFPSNSMATFKSFRVTSRLMARQPRRVFFHRKARRLADFGGFFFSEISGKGFCRLQYWLRFAGPHLFAQYLLEVAEEIWASFQVSRLPVPLAFCRTH
jgi:hypothetical protein